MKIALSMTAAVVTLLASTQARAFDFGTPHSEHPFRSPQNFALELRFSPYLPQIDDEPGLTSRPYNDAFGGARLLFAGEFDWQVYRIPHVGTIGPGFGLGYTSMSADAQTVTHRPSGDTTGLTIIPFWAVAVLRVDAFWREGRVPLVPYAKAGVAYGLWRAANTGGTSAAPNQGDTSGQLVSGRGGSWGTDLAAGIAFALDVLDPGATRNMDNAVGINNTYLFFEGYWLALNGLGQSHALRVGTATWAAGLTFEF